MLRDSCSKRLEIYTRTCRLQISTRDGVGVVVTTKSRVDPKAKTD
jgi:hypothetical protein